MSTAVLCLLLFVIWTLALVLTVGAVRVWGVLTGKQPPNSFPSGVPHGGDRYWRLNRAHLNAVENLPVFAAVVLAAEATGVRDGALAVAPYVLVGARVVQSVVHVASNANMVVNLRFTAFAVQLGCLGWMILELLQRAA